MTLENGRCTHCGFDQLIESHKPDAICKKCGRTFSVARAIEYYKQDKKITPEISPEHIQLLQDAINKNYPGMMMFVRDVNLSPSLIAKYRPGMIIREKALVDASARVGGMVTSCRYAILSNHMANFGLFEQGTNWQLHVANQGSHFKVLGTYTYQGKTAIFLLHLPDDTSWKLFQDFECNLDQQLLDDCIKRFEAKCLQPPIPEVTSSEWLDRCKFPLGMDDNGVFWPVDEKDAPIPHKEVPIAQPSPVKPIITPTVPQSNPTNPGINKKQADKVKSNFVSPLFAVLIGVLAVVVVIAIFASLFNPPASTSDVPTERTSNATTETTPKEIEFSQSVKSGQEVYADIVSIIPEYGISFENSTVNHSVVCRCTTSKGETVWLYMSTSEYTEHFDTSANLSYILGSFEELEYSPARRIYGRSTKAESVCDGLSYSIDCELVINYSPDE